MHNVNEEVIERVDKIKKTKGESYKAKFRWWALTCNFLYVMGPYFILDNPAELERPLQKQFKLTQTEYSFMYSAYSFPSLVVPLCNGIILDKMGNSFGLLMTTGICMLGQVIVVFGIN